MSANEYQVEGSAYCVVDKPGYRVLRVRGNEQSAMSVMRLDAPEVLVLPSAAVMFAFLLFKPRPADVVLIGLGGGDQARYIYKRMPQTRLVALEVEPALVRVARSHFQLPADDDRLSVRVGDGGDYLRSHPESCDVLLCDGYDPSHTVPDSAAGEAFYRACHQGLRSGGMLVANLFLHDGAEEDAHARAISKTFPAGFLIPFNPSQAVLFAFKDAPPPFDWAALAQRAEELEPHFQLKLPDLLEGLKAMLLSPTPPATEASPGT